MDFAFTGLVIAAVVLALILVTGTIKVVRQPRLRFERTTSPYLEWGRSISAVSRSKLDEARVLTPVEA